ncbi:MAG: nuclear transport factor 2 family protein [Candidatus Palauibacterales bacterium]|nr:nuclear transport factor 2 family protein [Candidatus Palauibacterales bacterium]MDP2482414.1 nuclear transport factor 2 family protein [Candidatus Palauibacterales bacterium]
MLSRYICTVVAGLLFTVPASGLAQVRDELDAYWTELARTVEEGDFDGYAALYHPDAVLVLDGSGSQPIAGALAGWQRLFVDTAEGRADASVAFRFTRLLNDATTAHETGIFRYRFAPKDGEEQVATVHFTALLVKRDGAWRMLMEHQKAPATEEEWEAAASRD